MQVYVHVHHVTYTPLLQIDGEALDAKSRCGGTFSPGDGSARSVPFRMTCFTGSMVAQNTSYLLPIFTPGYDNTTAEQTRAQAYDARFTDAGSTPTCVLTLAVRAHMHSVHTLC